MSRKIAITALLSSLALIVFIIENALPPLIPIAPGVKIGLSNIFVMLAVILCERKGVYALFVVIIKCVFGSMFTGNMFALAYSFPSSILSLISFLLLYHLLYKRISVVSMSLVSSLMFNLCQIFMAYFILQSTAIFLYLPYVAIVGSVTGIFTGCVVHFTVKNLPVKIL